MFKSLITNARGMFRNPLLRPDPTGTMGALVPMDSASWGNYESRLKRYSFYDTYYTNTAYNVLSTFANHYKRTRKLYKNIRGVYNPVQRLVQLYVSKIYGGSLDYENLEEGAIPVLGADDALRAAIRQVWIDSNWGRKKSLFARYGSKYGDSFIKIVDLPDDAIVRMELLHPGMVKEVKFGSAGDIESIYFEWQCYEEAPPTSLVRARRTYTLSLIHISEPTRPY